MLIVLYGTSCVGKTTLQKRLIEKYNVNPVRCYFTRDLREDDIARSKLTLAEFSKLVEVQKIGIVNDIFGNLYGTSSEDLDLASTTETNYVLDYSLLNYEQLIGYHPKNIIIIPENITQLEGQISKSGREERKDKIISEYLKLYSRDELEKFKEKKFSIVTNYSHNIDAAVREICEISVLL